MNSEWRWRKEMAVAGGYSGTVGASQMRVLSTLADDAQYAVQRYGTDTAAGREARRVAGDLAREVREFDAYLKAGNDVPIMWADSVLKRQKYVLELLDGKCNPLPVQSGLGRASRTTSSDWRAEQARRERLLADEQAALYERDGLAHAAALTGNQFWTSW